MRGLCFRSPTRAYPPGGRHLTPMKKLIMFGLMLTAVSVFASVVVNRGNQVRQVQAQSRARYQSGQLGQGVGRPRPFNGGQDRRRVGGPVVVASSPVYESSYYPTQYGAVPVSDASDAPDYSAQPSDPGSGVPAGLSSLYQQAASAGSAMLNGVQRVVSGRNQGYAGQAQPGPTDLDSLLRQAQASAAEARAAADAADRAAQNADRIVREFRRMQGSGVGQSQSPAAQGYGESHP